MQPTMMLYWTSQLKADAEARRAKEQARREERAPAEAMGLTLCMGLRDMSVPRPGRRACGPPSWRRDIDRRADLIDSPACRGHRPAPKSGLLFLGLGCSLPRGKPCARQKTLQNIRRPEWTCTNFLRPTGGNGRTPALGPGDPSNPTETALFVAGMLTRLEKMARSVGLDNITYCRLDGQVGSQPDPAREPRWAQRKRVRERTKATLTAAMARVRATSTVSAAKADFGLGGRNERKPVSPPPPLTIAYLLPASSRSSLRT